MPPLPSTLSSSVVRRWPSPAQGLISVGSGRPSAAAPAWACSSSGLGGLPMRAAVVWRRTLGPLRALDGAPAPSSAPSGL